MLHEPQGSYKTMNAPREYQSHQPPKQDTHQLSPQEFLKRWRESDIQKMAEAQNSDPAKYQKYMQRQKKPSIVAARVFMWERDVEDYDRWTHTEVPCRWRETTLGDYGGATYFSPIAYEWDCCEEFGMMPGTDDLMPNDLMPNDDEEAGEPLAMHSLTPPPFSMQDSDTLEIDLPSLRQFATALEGSSLEFVPLTVEGVLEEGEVEEGELQEEPVQEGKVQSINQEVLEILSMNYGFTHPISLPTKAVFPEDL
ncbi:hypothetical protein BDQ17DRAFT_1319906 [Cyathus striatus]|nr:hypothetical protein BDQ17DRAFT_1319906 [Cyathus striatus]